jgi:hypothetical protein
MTIRTTEKTVRFVRPFSLKGAERSFPAGAYRVITDEELIEGISLLAYRRVSTMILVPGVASVWTAESTTPSASSAKSPHGNDNETLRSPLSIMPAGFLFRLFPQRSPPWLFDHSSLRWLEINN